MTVPIAGTDLAALPVAAIYGANASGKSNVLHALEFLKRAVSDSQRTWEPTGEIPRQPFLLDEDSERKPSYFECDLLLNEVRFEYGVRLDSARVLDEWLLAYPKGKRQQWFVREADASKPFWFGRNLQGENRAIQALTRPNSLFLSAAAQNNHEMLRPVYDWFASELSIATAANRPEREAASLRMALDPLHRERVLEMLRAADLGIVDVTEKTPEDESRPAVLERPKTPTVGRAARGEWTHHLQTETTRLLMKQLGYASRTELLQTVSLGHSTGGGSDSRELPYTAESDGTRTMLALLGPMLTVLERGGLLCVDELDASLHPFLVRSVVQRFSDPSLNSRHAQLIFNTHDTHLLDDRLLRRDQVWFTEKAPDGSTHLYALTDFSPRREENWERGYLQGRFGALPAVGLDEHSEALTDQAQAQS